MWFFPAIRRVERGDHAREESEAGPERAAVPKTSPCGPTATAHCRSRCGCHRRSQPHRRLRRNPWANGCASLEPCLAGARPHGKREGGEHLRKPRQAISAGGVAAAARLVARGDRRRPRLGNSALGGLQIFYAPVRADRDRRFACPGPAGGKWPAPRYAAGALQRQFDPAQIPGTPSRPTPHPTRHRRLPVGAPGAKAAAFHPNGGRIFTVNGQANERRPAEAAALLACNGDRANGHGRSVAFSTPPARSGAVRAA